MVAQNTLHTSQAKQFFLRYKYFRFSTAFVVKKQQISIYLFHSTHVHHKLNYHLINTPCTNHLQSKRLCCDCELHDFFAAPTPIRLRAVKRKPTLFFGSKASLWTCLSFTNLLVRLGCNLFFILYSHSIRLYAYFFQIHNISLSFWSIL